MASASRCRIRDATGEMSMDCCLRVGDAGFCGLESCCIERDGVMLRGRVEEDEVVVAFEAG